MIAGPIFTPILTLPPPKKRAAEKKKKEEEEEKRLSEANKLLLSRRRSVQISVQERDASMISKRKLAIVSALYRIKDQTT